MENPTLNRMAEIKAQMKALEAEYKELLGSVDTDFQVGERFATNRGYIRVDRNRRFDAATAKEALGEDLYRGICTLQPDLAVAKKVLTGTELEDCYKEYAPKLVFVEVDDIDD